MVAVPSLRLIRYAGLLGAVLLAVAAYLGGAFRDFDPLLNAARIWRGERGPWIITSWLVGTALVTGAWWAARDRVPSARWAYLTAGLWLLPLLVAPPLGSRDVYPYACQGAVYAAGENPYHVSAADLPCQWLDAISPIWKDTPAPYGPLFVVLAGAAVAIGGSLTVIIVLLRVVAVAGVAVAAVSLPVLARRCGVPEGRALWLALACPLVGVHLVSGAHNDALMVGLLVAGLALATPGSWARLAGGGALIGLAVAVKATALVVLPFAALAAIAGPYRLRALVRDGGLVVGSALAAVLAVTIGSGLGFGWVGALSRSGDSVQWTSPPTAVGLTIGYAADLVGPRVNAVPAVRLVALAVLAAVLVALWWRARHGDPLRAAGTALVATVALGPVFHPWYATWPLAVVAATAVAIRQVVVGVCAAVSFLVLPDGTGLSRGTQLPGALAMTALLIAVGVLAWRHYRPLRRRSGSRAGPSNRSSRRGSPGQAATRTSRGT
jgi:alpha-1,6-mannosyltransferase